MLLMRIVESAFKPAAFSRGDEAADLPVEQATKVELIICVVGRQLD
jgi:hypothetical protein